MAVRPNANPPDVTVVLPVRNEATHLRAILDDILRQDVGDLRLEVLVVDGASEDGTADIAAEVARSDPRVSVRHNPTRRSSTARAMGVEGAQGRYVAFVDGHCRIPSRTMLRDMHALFERTGADCLARPQPLVPSQPSAWATAIALARSSPFGHSVHSTIYDGTEHPVSPVSAGAMYRREIFDRVGNFDATFDACEDVELNWRVARVGAVCWTSPRLALEYEPRQSLAGLLWQMYRYGLGRARLHRKHPEAFSWESLLPAGFTLGLPLLAASSFLPPPCGWLLSAPFLLYAAACAGFSVVAARADLRVLPLVPFAFLAIHVGLGTGYLSGLFQVPGGALEARGPTPSPT